MIFGIIGMKKVKSRMTCETELSEIQLIMFDIKPMQFKFKKT